MRFAEKQQIRFSRRDVGSPVCSCPPGLTPSSVLSWLLPEPVPCSVPERGGSVSSPQNSGKPGASAGGDVAPSHLALLHQLCPAPAASAAAAWPEAQGLQTLGKLLSSFLPVLLPRAGLSPVQRQGQGWRSLPGSDPDRPGHGALAGPR